MKYTIKGSYIQEFVKEITAESLKDAWEIAGALGREDIDPEEEIDQETNWGEVCIDSVMLEGHDYDPIEETNRVEVDIDDVIKCEEDDE